MATTCSTCSGRGEILRYPDLPGFWNKLLGAVKEVSETCSTCSGTGSSRGGEPDATAGQTTPTQAQPAVPVPPPNPGSPETWPQHLNAMKDDTSAGEEQRLARAKEEAAADARLTARPAKGVQLREYASAYVFQPEARAKRAYDALKASMRSGKAFPFKAPHQIALLHGRTADVIAVLVRLRTANDEGAAIHRRLVAWFAETGAGAFDDFETLRAPLPGRLSRGLEFGPGDQYSVLHIIDNL